MLIIKERDYMNNKNVIGKLNNLFNYIKFDKLPIYVFDVYNTLLYDDNKIDKDVHDFIEKKRKTHTVLLLSYDGNKKRILRNSKILNEYSETLFTTEQIYTHKRKKGFILKVLYNYLLKYSKLVASDNNPYIIFVDDELRNIKDARNSFKAIKNGLIAFHHQICL